MERSDVGDEAGVTIECAQPQDAEAILAVQRLAYRGEAALYDDMPLPPLTETAEAIRQAIASQVVLKATRAGQIIGSVRAYQRDGTCYIGRLVVHPNEQNRGLGTRQMHEVERLFPGVARFELFTGHRSMRNLHLYAKLGYRPSRHEYVDERLTLVYLEKRRGPDLETDKEAP